MSQRAQRLIPPFSARYGVTSLLIFSLLEVQSATLGEKQEGCFIGSLLLERL